MGYAIPGVCFNSGNPNTGFVGWISDSGGLVTMKTAVELNNNYGIIPNSLHFRLLKDIRLTMAEKLKVKEGIRALPRIKEVVYWLINRLLRYIYAVDKFEELTNWRLDHSFPLERAFSIIAGIIGKEFKSEVSMHIKGRIDGRYFFRKYIMDPEAYQERIQRPIDSEGKPIKGYPGVLTKDGLFWFIGDRYMRETWKAWRKVMIPDETAPPVNNQDTPMLQKLPPEVLIDVLSYSKDLTSVKLISKYFNSFVNLHRDDILSRYISMNFIVKKSLRSNMVSDSMAALMRHDDDHLLASNQMRLSQIKNRSSQLSHDDNNEDGFQMKFNALFYSNGIFKSNRYTDAHYITLLFENGLDDLTFTIFNDLKVDYIIPEGKMGEFNEKFQELKEEVGVEFIDKIKINEIVKEFKLKFPFQNWDSLPRNKLFNSFLILTDLISNGLVKFDLASMEIGLIQMVSMALKLRIIIPNEMINKFIIDLKPSPPVEPPAADAEPVDEETKLYSGKLFVLLNEYQRVMKTETYASVLHYFHGGHLNNDVHFWIYLRDNAPHLIGELLSREDIQPEVHILNDLASTII